VAAAQDGRREPA